MFRNFLILSSGEITARALHVVAFLLLARALKPTQLGTFELAVAVSSWALLVVQQGFDAIAIKDVARDPSQARPMLVTVLRLRLTLGLAMSVFVASSIAIIGSSRPTATLILMFCGSYFINALTPRWIFVALERPRPLAIASALSQAVLLGAAAGFVHSPEHAPRAVAGWMAGELACVAFLWTRLGRLPSADPSACASAWRLLRESWPVFVSLLLGQVLYNFDVLALASLGEAREIGLYLAAYRFVTLSAPVVAQFQASIFPTLARAHSNRTELRRLAGSLAFRAGATGFVCAVLLSASANVVLPLVFGAAYREAAPLLRTLAWVLPLQGIRAVLRQVLMTGGLQLFDTRNVAFAAFTNVALDLALIPRYGGLGSAISTVCSEIVFVGMSIQAIQRKLPKEAL